MPKPHFIGIDNGQILFGRFEVVEPLDTSNVGGVYLCRNKAEAESLSVLKILYKPSVSYLNPGTAFLTEAAVARRVRSPYVVASYALHVDDDFFGLEMEYLAGGSLDTKLRQGTRFSIGVVIDLLKQLCQGLKAIHAAGVIHRDLKPENIFFDAEGCAKIGDFGIALNVGEESKLEDHLVGTLNYLSPEYVRQGKVSQQSDIYSLGIIAYELITGQLPFAGQDLIESLTLSVENDPARPRKLRPGCPLALERFILRAIARAPEKRFKSAAKAAAFLDSLDELELELTGASGSLLIPARLAAELSVEVDSQ